ncbi:hypothetical protein H5796_25625 [Klebsiella pneumoniae]|nr:hypothetical protein [Klebsiella pneumoniae]MCB3612895.1 hypothetical protein [Klebsiella pneumoniae]
MTSLSLQCCDDVSKKYYSIQELGEIFINGLPEHIAMLKIPGRWIAGDVRKSPVPARIDHVKDIQNMMYEVLCHEITQEAQTYAEGAFLAFLKKDKVDPGLLSFFNGWNETHKTTSLVSGKIIMRLSADALYISHEDQAIYHNVLAHMHEVTKDDFGLGQKGHDGMYKYMTNAFRAAAWVDDQYKIKECNEFSDFLYNTGIAKHKSAMRSPEHLQSVMDAMMVSVASELWNGREYNFLAQFIEGKLLSFNASLNEDTKTLRNAKGYVMGHAGEVENRHGLHALAALQAFGRIAGLSFDTERLKYAMLDYNKRVGVAFSALQNVLTH